MKIHVPQALLWWRDQRATEAAQTQVVRSHAVEAEPLEDADERLQLFLQWAVNNGAATRISKALEFVSYWEIDTVWCTVCAS